MSKFSLLSLTLAVAVTLIFCGQAKGQSSSKNSYNNVNGTAADPFGAAPGMGGGSSGRPSKPASDGSDGDSTDPNDPSLYRMKTKDSLASGAMSRDDGELTAKIRKREKISNVDAKKLPTSKTDPKFQGSLLQSGVGSISDIGEKAHLDLQPKGESEEKENSDSAIKDENEARFKARQLMLSTEEQTKKTESPPAKSDSSPSPSPSRSASVAPSNR